MKNEGRGIDANAFLRLWEDLKARERETDSSLSRRVGISASSPTQWRQGKVGTVQFKTLKRIEEELKVRFIRDDSGVWRLVERVLSAFDDTPPEGDPIDSLIRMPGGKRGFRTRSGKRISLDEAKKRQDLVFVVSDNSLYPKYVEGDLVFTGEIEVPKEGEIGVFAIQSGEEIFIRRIFSNQGCVALVPTNPLHETIVVKRSDIDFVALVRHSHSKSLRFRSAEDVNKK